MRFQIGGLGHGFLDESHSHYGTLHFYAVFKLASLYIFDSVINQDVKGILLENEKQIF